MNAGKQKLAKTVSDRKYMQSLNDKDSKTLTLKLTKDIQAAHEAAIKGLDDLMEAMKVKHLPT